MLQYKSRLLLYSGRFTELEFRVLRRLRDANTTEFRWLADLDLLIEGLLRDGYLVDPDRSRQEDSLRDLEQRYYVLTAEGRAFADRYLADEI